MVDGEDTQTVQRAAVAYIEGIRPPAGGTLRIGSDDVKRTIGYASYRYRALSAMFPAMTRVIASLLFVGLIFTAGCKKDTPKESSETASAAESSLPSRPQLASKGDTAPECQKLCMVIGKCTLRDKKCYATSTPACRASFACKAGGLCEAKDGSCVAVRDEDCAASDFCATQGKCLAVNGKCENKNVMPSSSASPAASGSANPANSGK